MSVVKDLSSFRDMIQLMVNSHDFVGTVLGYPPRASNKKHLKDGGELLFVQRNNPPSNHGFDAAIKRAGVAIGVGGGGWFAGRLLMEQSGIPAGGIFAAVATAGEAGTLMATAPVWVWFAGAALVMGGVGLASYWGYQAIYGNFDEDSGPVNRNGNRLLMKIAGEPNCSSLGSTCIMY